VNDDVRSGADGPVGDSGITQIADDGPGARHGRLMPACHGNLGAAAEQRRDEPSADEA
jgi:hypothetical protein